MRRIFECQNCHQRFEADDQGEVKCPHCQSDNVEYARFRIPKGIWKYALALAAILLVGWFFMQRGDKMEEPSIEPVDTTAIDTIMEEFVDPDVKIVEPPKISYSSDLKYEDDGYSFTVKVKNAPASPYYVAVLEHRGKSVIAKSEDGTHFTKVPPSKNQEGIYDLAIFDAKKDSLLGDVTPKSGFIPQTKLKNRMTEQQLQALIDNDDMSLYGIHEAIDPNCKLHFTGLSSETKSIPTTMGEVMEKVGRMWSSVKVTKLEYNDKNRIVAITMAVRED